jgi:hypothetical protein
VLVPEDANVLQDFLFKSKEPGAEESTATIIGKT